MSILSHFLTLYWQVQRDPEKPLRGLYLTLVASPGSALARLGLQCSFLKIGPDHGMKASKQDDWQDVPSLELSPDDIRGRERPEKNNKPKNNPPKPSGKSSGFLGGMVMLLALAMVGGGGFAYYQYTQLAAQLKDSQAQTMAALKQLDEVSGKVTQTDANISQSGSQVNAQLKMLDSEVRKLWDLANKRNRQDIAKLEAQLAKQEQLNKSLTGDIAGVTKQAKETRTAVDKALAELKSTRAELNKSLASLEINSSLQREQLQGIEQQQKQLTSDLHTGTQEKEITALKKRLSKYDDAIRSMDQYRQQVNRQLLTLQKQISNG